MSVVGKYRYLMDSAMKRGHLPVIVDIFLVGRTKIITLHSSIWVSGASCFRLLRDHCCWEYRADGNSCVVASSPCTCLFRFLVEMPACINIW